MRHQKGFIPIAIIIVFSSIVAASSYFFVFKKDAPKPIDLPVEVKLENKQIQQPKTKTTAEVKPPIPTQSLVQKKQIEYKIPADTQKPSTNSSYTNATPTPLSPQRQSSEFPTQSELKQIPACDGQQFTTAPVDTQKITSISPLGNIAPPGHTFPTEHMFFHLTPGGATTETVPLQAPADIYLTLISFGRGFTQDPIDYTLYFTLCKDVIGYYNHVKELSPELENLISQSSCMFPGENKETQCHIQTLYKIANGVTIGKVGRLQGNFDFGLIDQKKPLVFANSNRYGKRSLYIQCALDYYRSEEKNILYNLLERKDGKCGLTAQDVPGTLKGNWFYGSARADMGGDWDKHLAFVDDNKNPSLAVISIGGIISTAEKWEFTPETSGTKNKTFSDVKPDGQTYCYETEGNSGRIIVQLTSTTELKIEKQNQSCADNLVFINPTTYKR